MLDAGSSKTRYFIYRWNPHSARSIPELNLVQTEAKNRGLFDLLSLFIFIFYQAVL